MFLSSFDSPAVSHPAILKPLLEHAPDYPFDQPLHCRALVELDVGTCDGLTYAQVEAADPSGFAARSKDKLRYRYPQGESYLDIIDRVESIIFELERAVRVSGYFFFTLLCFGW